MRSAGAPGDIPPPEPRTTLSVAVMVAAALLGGALLLAITRADTLLLDLAALGLCL